MRTSGEHRRGAAQHCEHFLREARQYEAAGRLDAAWASLVCAHIIGQRVTSLHVRSHAAMLGLAWRTGNRSELVGQLSRLLGALAATWIWIPEGNTGRANVSAFKRMPIPAELSALTKRE